MGDTPTALQNLSTVVTECMGNLAAVATTIGGNTLLLLGVGVWFTGASIGLAKRLIGRT